MKEGKSICFLVLVIAFLTNVTLWAIPTDIIVRVKSKDAKFIGSSIGGALVTIKDADTGEVLATGLTAGSTGDTKLIMNTPNRRGTRLSDDDSAKFSITLDISDPILTEITAIGPRAQRQSENKIVVNQWIIPGKHITEGDALMLELPGFVVDILAPPAHVKYGGAPQAIRIKANVTMMCGCPVQPNGVWDANKFTIEAILKKGGEKVEVIKLNYAGEVSQFSGDYAALEAGTYEIFVYAFDKSNGNTGIDRTTFVIN